MRNVVVYGGFIIFVFRVFGRWFNLPTVSSGDWMYKSPDSLANITDIFNVWDGAFNNGIGGNAVFQLALNSYFLGSAKILHSVFGLTWGAIEKIVWYWPFLILASIGPYVFLRKFVVKHPVFAVAGSAIFATNTYILMLTGGGQMGVAMGYAMIPVVCYAFFSVLAGTNTLRLTMLRSIMLGLSLAVTMLFDLRMFFITVIVMALVHIALKTWSLRMIIWAWLVPFLIVSMLHAFWLIPLIVFRANPLVALGEAYSGTGMVKFLSFAFYEQAISLLHPNWPDNVFGKIGFLRPEFLVIPIAAYASLLFATKRGDANRVRHIHTFAIIGLIGSFLSKGANEPFSGIYIWMFEHVPGFAMFRDPTKWYALTATSYAFLVPITLEEWTGRVRTVYRNLIILGACIFWIAAIRHAVAGSLSGTFSYTEFPSSYTQLEKFIARDSGFYRTVWFPRTHILSYSSKNHPAMSADVLFGLTDPLQLDESMLNVDTSQKLARLGIRYIIIPEDTNGTIFTTDRSYDPLKYQRAIETVSALPWASRVQTFGGSVVFEIAKHNGLFWTERADGLINDIQTVQHSPTEYSVPILFGQDGNLIFSQGYDPGWFAEANGTRIRSQPTNDRLNRFSLPAGYTGTVRVYFEPQKWVYTGVYGSTAALLLVVILAAAIVFTTVQNRVKRKDERVLR